MTINIEELKRDRDAGTDGPWRVDGDRDDYETFIVGSPSWGCERYGVKGEWEVAKIDVMDDRPNETEANARRIARLPDLEAAFLEAVERQERQYHVGPLTFDRVFRAGQLENLYDMQAVLDAVERALEAE